MPGSLNGGPAMPGGGQGDETVAMAEGGQEIETVIVPSAHLVPIPSVLDHDMSSSHLVRGGSDRRRPTEAERQRKSAAAGGRRSGEQWRPTAAETRCNKDKTNSNNEMQF